MKRKALALVLSFAMLMTVCVPGTFATEADAQSTLVCGQTEHTHTDACYEEVLICGEETNAADEPDGDANNWYETDEVLDGAQEAPAKHIHDESCYSRELICGLEEHQHSDECYETTSSEATPSDAEEPSGTIEPDAPVESDPSEPICTCGSEDGVHAEDCPLCEMPVTPESRVLTDGVVTVMGDIPEDVELVVEDYSDLMMLPTFAEDAGQQPLARLNITLYNPDGSEWQPEDGQSVSVTLNATELGLEDGHNYVVSHIHEDEYGETTTDFGAIPYDGELTFELNGFSYILVFDGVSEIENIKAFYRAELETADGSDSTNGQITFLGVYYDENDKAHFLLAAAGNTTATAVDSKVQSIQLDGLNIPKGQMQYETFDKKINRIEIRDDSGDVIHTIAITGKGTYGGYYDITLPGGTVVRDGFEFGVNGNIGGNGWKIGGLVNIDLEYTLTKEVAAGSSATGASFGDSLTVERGEWVIYKITVANTGTQELTGMIVTDTLPMGAFVEGTVEMGVGEADGTIPDWEPFNETLFDNYDSPGQFTRSIYITAQVKPDLNISGPATYTNTAYINGMNMPEQSDSAVITVNPPKSGTLVVSKEVTSENPMDQAPDTEFNFVVTDANGNTYKFSLGSGGSHEIPAFPVGDFTVVETDAGGYVTSVNGQTGTTFKGTMVADNPPVVAYVNQFSTRNTTLSITKQVEKAYTNDVLPENQVFNFVVTIAGEGVPGSYSYTISGGGSGEVQNEDTISLKAGETANIQGIPVGASYTIVEDMGDLANDYDLTSVSGGTTNVVNGTSGTLDINGAELTFVNTYKRHLADLTISKSGWDTIDENQTFIFRVQGEGIDLRVVIQGNGSKTIKDLPIGNYTVTEETEWSWRYAPAPGSTSVDLGEVNGYSGNAGFANTRQTETSHPAGNTDWKWLNGAAYKKNKFDGIE